MAVIAEALRQPLGQALRGVLCAGGERDEDQQEGQPEARRGGHRGSSAGLVLGPIAGVKVGA